MTERKPLVIGADGGVQELQSGDNLPGGPSSGLPPLHLCGYGLTNGTDAGKINIAAGLTMSEDNVHTIISMSTLTADLAVSGLNGLDTGVEQSDVFYNVFVIYNPTTQAVASLLSLNSTAPTLPAGYTTKRRLGQVRNFSGNLLQFYAYPECSRWRQFNYLEDRSTTLRVLSGGSAIVWTEIDCSSLIPPTSSLVRLDIEAISKAVRIRPKGNSIANYHKVQVNQIAVLEMEVGTNQRIEYKFDSTGGSLYLGIRSYFEEL